MISPDNQRFLEIIESHVTFSKIIADSLKKPRNQNSIIFRRGNFWYRFENWDLPHSGVIREWSANDEDWFPKQDFTEKLSKENSREIFNIANPLAEFDKCKIMDIKVSSDGILILLIVERYGTYDAIILNKATKVILHRIKNISIESSFFFGDDGFIFCRADEYLRPNKLYYRSFKTDSDELLYVESNVAFRIKILTRGEKGNCCLVKSMDFQKGSLFLYTFNKERLYSYTITKNTVLPRYYDIMLVPNKIYFVYLKKQLKNEPRRIVFREIKDDNTFEIELKSSEIVRELRCVGKIILLDISTKSQFSYLLLKFKSISFPAVFEEIKINFQKNTLIYDNTYSDCLLMFSQKDFFSETILSYKTTENILKEEFSTPIFPNGSDYNYKIIWAEKEKDSIRIPISLIWKSETPNKAKLPEKKVVL